MLEQTDSNCVLSTYRVLLVVSCYGPHSVATQLYFNSDPEEWFIIKGPWAHETGRGDL